MRYEIKIPVQDYNYSFVENAVKLNSKCFREIFFERRVNNIYFDDMNYTSFKENVNGIAQRSKCRLRWYGDIFGNIEPALEIKIKEGSVGYKRTYKLEKVGLPHNFENGYVLSYLLNSDIPKNVLEQIKISQPVLLNSYLRKYFLSFDKKFRVTIDKEIQYTQIDSGLYSGKSNKEDIMVLEIKYKIDDEPDAHNILSELPFRTDKNSKYAKGMALTKNW